MLFPFRLALREEIPYREFALPIQLYRPWTRLVSKHLLYFALGHNEGSDPLGNRNLTGMWECHNCRVGIGANDCSMPRSHIFVQGDQQPSCLPAVWDDTVTVEDTLLPLLRIVVSGKHLFKAMD